MGTTIPLVPPFMTLVLGLVVLLAGSAWADAESAVVLSGEIEPADYDDDGEVTAVSIYDAEWGSVLISPEGKGKNLLDHVGAIVEMKGEITEMDEDSDYEYVVEVASYKIVEPAAPEDDPDWGPEGDEEE